MSEFVIDYGMGNIHSVVSALNVLNVSARVSSDPDEISEASHLVLPGVGSFLDGMKNLRESGLDTAIIDFVNHTGYLLGICLGMQLLADKGTEGGESNGLGLINGRVVKLSSSNNSEKIPHVGWNEINYTGKPELFNGIATDNDFYFVHSYHFVPKNTDNIISTSNYCNSFVSCVNSKNVWGVQFHPEKSSKYGLKILENFINLD